MIGERCDLRAQGLTRSLRGRSASASCSTPPITMSWGTPSAGRLPVMTQRTSWPKPSWSHGVAWTTSLAKRSTRPWLYGVARRVLANQRRSTGRRELLAARLREVPRLPVIDAPFLEGLSEVGAVLHRLAPGDREILALHAWEGLDSQELGAALGCSSGAARVRLYRARRRFAQASADSDLSFVPRTEQTGPHTLRTRMSTEDSA